MSSSAPGGIVRLSAPRWAGEVLRGSLLLGWTLWLTHPFFTSRLIGSGDAWWYGNMLRDFLMQLRQGIFPVWTGQTEFAFNGAVYPLRAAPYYQYLGGLLDLLTGRRLDAFTIQHGTVIVSFLAAAFTSYWSLCRLAPNRRNAAALLTALYLSCPAVLALATSMDLVMSVMALPYLPVVACGLALCLQEPGWRPQRMVVAGLAATWYAHAPLAAWLTLVAIVVQVVRIAGRWRDRQAWLEALGSAVLLAALVASVFVSVGSLRGADHAGLVPYAIDRDKILAAVHSAFPACLCPVRMPAVNLGDLQLGYALGAVLLAGAAFTTLPGRRRHLALSIPAAAFIVLLLPIPGVTPWLWHHVPESLARLTNDWPMHRLVPLLAALSLPLGMLALGGSEVTGNSDQTRSPSPLFPPSLTLSFSLSLPFLLLAVLALAWAGHEAGKLVATVALRTASTHDTAIKRRPENAPLMNHAYGLSLALPPYFSNGVMDPWFELRVLNGGKVIEDNATNRLADQESPWSELATRPDPNPGVWDLAPDLTLRPGLHYLLEFDFGGQTYSGTLQFEGEEFFRQYRLPESGQPLAFGTGPLAAHWIPLWTTLDRPEAIRVCFIPDTDTDAGRPAVFARFRCLATEPRALPLHIDSYAPLRLTVALAHSGLLETFRMYFPGYRAEVDGRPAPVVPSPNHLAAVALPAGMHNVVIGFRPPWPLPLAKVASAMAWLGMAILGLKRRVG